MSGLLGSCAGRSRPQVTLHLETGESIVLELYPEKAPTTVNNFLRLASNGYYNGKVFGRAVGGYQIACDSYDAAGDRKDIGYRIRGEFAMAGFAQNDLKHEAGVISMARENAAPGVSPESSYHTASSNFVILSAESARMDGLYAVFGRVISGMDAVDRIAAAPTVGEDLVQPVVIKSAVVKYKGYQPAKELESVTVG